MTKETLTALRENIRIGYTEKRGLAWWADPNHSEGNHFEGPVPEKVARDLIGWVPLEAPVQATFLGEDGVTTVTDDRKKMYVNPRTMTPVGIVGKGHKAHTYAETLIDIPELLVDGKLGIGSVGTLNEGGRAFVQFEMGENVDAAEGVEFRPFLTAATSLDGSLRTTFITGAQVVVCDNTLSLALSSAATEYGVRHTRNSVVNVQDARSALGLVEHAAEDFQQQVAALTAQVVSEDKWQRFLELYNPIPEDDKGRSFTMATNKRSELESLWNDDPRVAPWKGSAWGVLAATNTWFNHHSIVRNMSRDERRMQKLIDGAFDKSDNLTLELLRVA